MYIARPLSLLLALSLFVARSAPAQSLFGSILGSVTDASHATVVGATVRIRDTGTNAIRTVKTDHAGDYQAPALAVGNYEVSCEAAGFKRALVASVNLEVDQRARVDIQLELGAIEQQVQVAAAISIIETDTASQGTVIDNRRIVELPLNGRNFEQLAVMACSKLASATASTSTGTGRRLLTKDSTAVGIFQKAWPS
jgi:uncharacterized surface anchored protein